MICTSMRVSKAGFVGTQQLCFRSYLHVPLRCPVCSGAASSRLLLEGVCFLHSQGSCAQGKGKESRPNACIDDDYNADVRCGRLLVAPDGVPIHFRSVRVNLLFTHRPHTPC